MNQKESMMLHIRLDPVTHKRMKHVCVDLGKSMQDYVYELIKKAVEK
jgi:predicted DNA-binding protein